MFAWPNLDLTDYERKFVRIYKTKDKPGVLRRTYKVVLTDTAIPAKNLPIIQLSAPIQISRRSRVFGLSFSGNTDSWRLNVSNASGTQYTVKDAKLNQDPVVSSMVPGTLNNAVSLGALSPPLGTTSLGEGIGPNQEKSQILENSKQPFPFIIEPNWLLMPNETLIFTGTPIPVSALIGVTTVVLPLTLTIAVHVWEFPVMGTAPASAREIL